MTFVVTTKDTAADQGVSDPEPGPSRRSPKRRCTTRTRLRSARSSSTPAGTMVCSGTVITDVNHPGKSHLVWTAGHCVHAGGEGGWYRTIVFVPAYNDRGRTEAQLGNATATEIAPHGNWWADWASTSNEWIAGGSTRAALVPRTTTPCCT